MKIIKSLIALSIVIFIPFGIMIWMRIHETSGFASQELIAYPLLFGGGSILVLVLLKKYFLKEPLSEFNAGKGNALSDIGWGLALTLIYFILFYLERATLSDILSFRSNSEMMNLMLDMRNNTLWVILWFGPVLWIGIALYEELIRVFLLSSMWKWSESTYWIGGVIVFSAVLIGLGHWYQGPYGIVTIGIKSLVSGFFYFKIRRLFPLVLAHALYDGIQVGLFMLTYPG